MNAINAKDYVPLVIALSEGKTIQQCVMSQQTLEMEWRDDLTPTWNASDARFYRVKPEPPEPRRYWIVKKSEHDHFVTFTKDGAAVTKKQIDGFSGCGDGCEIIEVIEVLK